jgi:hypothetical protein
VRRVPRNPARAQWLGEGGFSPSLDVDILDPKFLDALKLFTREDAPPEYGAWVDQNLSYYDPVFRACRLRESIPLISRNQASYKCWDDRCPYYIYGFSNPEGREQHLKEHVAPTKIDFGLSASSAQPLVFSEPAVPRFLGPEHIQRSPPVPLPRLAVPSTLPPLAATVNQPRDGRRDSLLGYSFVNELPPGQPRGSVDSEVDPLLPPLKRSRVGHGRLESIGELRLPRETGPCLRCKVQAKPVSQTLARPCCPHPPTDLS